MERTIKDHLTGMNIKILKCTKDEMKRWMKKRGVEEAQKDSVGAFWHLVNKKNGMHLLVLWISSEMDPSRIPFTLAHETLHLELELQRWMQTSDNEFQDITITSNSEEMIVYHFCLLYELLTKALGKP